MKRYLYMVWLLGFLMCAVTRAADDGAVSAGLDLPVLSGYVWRGQVLNDEAVVQPSLTVTKGGLSLNTWGNFNLTDEFSEEGDQEFTEVDLTVSYAGSVGPVGYGVGVVEYLFPHQTLGAGTPDATSYPGTREVYATLSLSDLPVVPTLSGYYDVDEADGLYLSLGLAYSADLGGKATLGLSGLVGYATSDDNAFYYGVDDAAFNDASVGATLSFSPVESLTITPGVQYVTLIDDDIKDAAAAIYKDDSAVVGSLKASYAF